MAVIAARVLKINKASTVGFTDVDLIADYAMESVGALVELGVLSGFEDGSFKPQEPCLRAQAAKVICRLLEVSVNN